jgi:transcriptional regulator with XRE-family HTH domain
MEQLFFGTNLKYLRLKRGATQSSTAFALGKRSTAVSSWEAGLSAPPLSELPKIADYFGVSMCDLIGIKLSTVQNRKIPAEEKKRPFCTE